MDESANHDDAPVLGDGVTTIVELLAATEDDEIEFAPERLGVVLRAARL